VRFYGIGILFPIKMELLSCSLHYCLRNHTNEDKKMKGEMDVEMWCGIVVMGLFFYGVVAPLLTMHFFGLYSTIFQLVKNSLWLIAGGLALSLVGSLLSLSYNKNGVEICPEKA